MIKLLKKLASDLIEDFGYNGYTDYFYSTFHSYMIKPIAILSVSLSTFTFITNAIFTDYVGLQPIVYLSFFVLLLMEFATGIYASLKEGKKIESRKLGRFILKIASYTLVLTMVNIFSKHIGTIGLFGNDFNMYAYVYSIVLNMIIIQLIISVLENLSRLGFRETSSVMQFIMKRFDKYLNLKEKE